MNDRLPVGSCLHGARELGAVIEVVLALKSPVRGPRDLRFDWTEVTTECLGACASATVLVVDPLRPERLTARSLHLDPSPDVAVSGMVRALHSALEAYRHAYFGTLP